ncbi:hypothetical protein BKA83DRAFT_1574031 [Pisolithus microcarpus]|nr:hypothetical protein BKA83DRAFT_1574031 [Pisolithus microcarpus]
METSPLSDLLSVNAAQEDGLRARPPTLPCTSSAMRCNLLKGGEQFTAAESDPGVVFSLLQKWHQTFLGRNKALGQFAHERQRLRGEIESISQTLGAELFEHILIAFCQPELTGRAHYIQYDRQLDPLSVVRDIRALQAKLDATKDMDEQRALEEDATGKILWLFWCGICAEVEELLRKVADLIRREEMMKYALQHIRGLQSEVDPSDDQVHLRRIMLDAEANTSKYQLWLEARAIGTPSTSRQALSTSVA